MCDSQRGVYMDVGSDEHTASTIPKFCGSSLIDVNGREREKEGGGGGRKGGKRSSFVCSFLPLIATICRNLLSVNNRITEIAFFDPA